MAQPKPGSIVHVEFHSTDPARTREFYGKVFGWKFTEVPEMNYMLFEAPAPPHGGLSLPMEGMPPGVLNYILAASIDTVAERIEGAGGTILVPRTEIPNSGWFALFRDPTGTIQGLFEAPARPRRARRTRRPRPGRGRARTRR